MKIVWGLIFAFFYLFSPIAGKSQITINEKSISFVDYGPVAFDSFWRIPQDGFEGVPAIRLSPRISTDRYHSFFLTQYSEADIPLGGGHVLSLRVPYHYFNVDQSVAQNLRMANHSGKEFGDIDIFFNIIFFKKKISKMSNDRFLIYLTGEMNTAPTNRDNRQFTDVLKMLGTMNCVYDIINVKNNLLKGVLSIGGGGWDDFVFPFQKHLLKVSGKFTYNYTFEKQRAVGIFAGGTYIYAEGENNKGTYLKTGWYFQNIYGIRLGFSLGRLNYHDVNGNFVNQYELTSTIPLKWHF